MKNIKKSILAIALVSVLLFSIAACTTGNGSSEKSSDSSASTADSSSSSSSTDGEGKVLKVGATPAPHAEFLKVVKPILEKQGITLEIVEYDDYNLINAALDEGAIDANFFQHEPYLLDQIETRSFDLAGAGFIHYEPMGIYAGQKKSVDELEAGDTIVVPNDATNEGRALLLLQAHGIITLNDNIVEKIGVEATVKDIKEYLIDVEILEVDAAQTPAHLDSVALAVINGNFALSGGVADKVITVEDENSVAASYANLVAVKKGNENNEEIKALVKALKGEEVKKYTQDNYGKTVVIVD